MSPLLFSANAQRDSPWDVAFEAGANEVLAVLNEALSDVVSSDDADVAATVSVMVNPVMLEPYDSACFPANAFDKKSEPRSMEEKEELTVANTSIMWFRIGPMSKLPKPSVMPRL